MVKTLIGWFKRVVFWTFDFFSSDIAVFSGSMSFITIFSFIPFLMLGVFAAVNLSFFAEAFNAFRAFLYANLFEGSADNIVFYVNLFLQNSEQLGIFGVIFATYSIFVFIKQLDYCLYKIADVKEPYFGFGRFFRYLAVISFSVLSMFLSVVFEAIGSFFALFGIAFLASFVQIWVAMILLFLIVSPIRQSIKKTFLYSFGFTILFFVLKKAFVYYILLSGTVTTIYGSFAAVFWFFIWLNMSWYLFFVSFKLYLKH